MGRTFIARSQTPEDVSRETGARAFHVKRPVAMPRLFHVKQPLTLKSSLTLKRLFSVVRKRRSLPDAEFPEDHVENILDIDAPEQPAERIGRQSQILRGELLATTDHVHAPLQRVRGLLQQLPLPLPADQPALARFKIIPCERDQGGDQFRDAVTPPRGNPELVRYRPD